MLGIMPGRIAKSRNHSQVEAVNVCGWVGAKVTAIAQITPDGQLEPSGNVVLAPTTQNIPQPYGVILEMDEELFEAMGVINFDNSYSLPGGALSFHHELTKIT